MNDGVICSSECAVMARYTEAYVEAVRARLLPAISTPDPSIREQVEDAYMAVISATSDHDGEPDVSMAYSAAQDVEEEAADDHLFVYEQVLGLAIAGLFHVWERAMRRVLIRAIRFQLPVPDRQTIERADTKQLLSALQATGMRLPSSSILERLNELRLIANVVKHGSGASLRELAEFYPERFDGMEADIASPDFLSLTEEDLNTFGDAVATFWRTIPKTGPLSPFLRR